MAIFIAPLLVFTFLGIVLTRLGWRGVAIDDHPLCRRCGYDLHGQPAATICPECGANVSSAPSRVVGHRRRLRGPLGIGVVVLLLIIVISAAFGTAAARRYDWNRLKPVWLLLREARSRSGSTAALSELLRRLSATGLDQNSIDRIADAALVEQADRSRPWQPTWGDFMEPHTS